MTQEAYHTTVLLHDAIDVLEVQPNGIYVDVTYGGGGHSREILKKLENGRLFAFDQDKSSERNLIQDDKLTFISENFRHMRNFLAFHHIKKVDGVLADLGVSGHQFDAAERGFSIRFNSDLDMRMNQNQPKGAKEIISEQSAEELMQMFNTNADLKKVPTIAHALHQAAKDGVLNTTDDLRMAVVRFAPKHKENKFLAQVFQAIRIEVNDELGALKEMLEGCKEIIKPNGRLVVISYHSLEDRLVKNFLRSGSFDGTMTKDFYGNLIRPFKPLSNKAKTPDKKELEKNNRARSAKMRTGIRNGE